MFYNKLVFGGIFLIVIKANERKFFADLPT